MKLVKRAYICPYIVLIDDDEGLENVDASFERYGEWDVEPRRQECDKNALDRSEAGRPRTYWRNKQLLPRLLLASVAPTRETPDSSSRDSSHGGPDERVNVDAFIHRPMARRCE